MSTSDDEHGDEQGADDLALPAGLVLPLDAEPGPATTLDAARADAIVLGALDGWQGQAQPAPSSPAQPAPSQLFRLAAAAAAVLSLATVGTAAALLWWRPGAAPPAPSEAEVTRQDEPPAAAQVDVLPEPAAAQVDVLPEPAAAQVDVLPEPAPAPPAPEAETLATPEPEEVVAPPETRARPRTAREAPSEDLLAEANALRGAGRFREAEALYQRVARSERGAFTGYVAEVAAAGVRVEHLRDARGALAGYRRALAARPGGPLDAEAREGEARALRVLGDRAGEARALEALVSAHPSSAQARRARSRLEELSESGTR